MMLRLVKITRVLSLVLLNEAIGRIRIQYHQRQSTESRAALMKMSNMVKVLPWVLVEKTFLVQTIVISFPIKIQDQVNCGITIGNKTRTPCGVIFLTDKINETPGPGRYKTYKSASKGGKITSSSNRFQENRQSTPGPGYY
jgi:hypothetical protein